MALAKVGPITSGMMPLQELNVPLPIPGESEVLIRVSACGVCHTELDIIEGRTSPLFLPLIPGHQVVGFIESAGKEAHKFHPGTRVGAAWFHAACGSCIYCKSGKENLCRDFAATGRDCNGGYAEYMTAPEESLFTIPDFFSDAQAAPLLCAGAIGYRSLILSDIKNGGNLGLMGFGTSARLVLAMARKKFPQTQVFVFARKADQQALAVKNGAAWAGAPDELSPQKLNAIIETTPAWGPVIDALKNLLPGGRLIINAISKDEADKKRLMELDYAAHLWMEKEIKTVANVTREDVRQCLALAAAHSIALPVQEYPLDQANQAILDLKQGKISGAKVLRIA
ncbi:MAG: alcohol dehydrogenase catalytic domain-containing protein [Chitinivibrionales bacterium]|nr:alcohol dehydrogenase catalytic domain-containing protein [Chitinivibrionales bacterium]